MKGLSIFNVKRSGRGEAAEPGQQQKSACSENAGAGRARCPQRAGVSLVSRRAGDSAPYLPALRSRLHLLSPYIAGILLSLIWSEARAGEAMHGMVASGHPLVTVAFMLGVVDGDNAGIGGGCFILIRRANGEFVAIDGRETAPAAARRDMFIRNGKGDTSLSQTGSLASGVPGALAAYEMAVRKYGKKKLRDAILPAADLAERGFTVDASYAARLKSVAAEMAGFESSRKVFFKGDQPLSRGD